ncbi:MAG: precorrin-3B C(17)-methyltransferase [Methanobacteriaceae archaeon]|nr:precorrin-3B C(17)-methyltransferase [Methanobacteriaceae archaeon]
MIKIVGIGPTRDDMTFRAFKAIKDADVIIGYKKYIDKIRDIIKDKEVIEKGMREEIKRAEIAIKKHREGKNVALISSGDPGIFGMANVFFHLIDKYSNIEVEVIPGVTAVNYAASLLGAPLHDFAVISLSDILTPLSEIKKKVENAVTAGFIIVFYNPKSKRRKRPLMEALKIIKEHLAPYTPVGVVKDGKAKLTNLQRLDVENVDMSTTIIIGNPTTYIKEGYMITPRGYALKYFIHPLAREYYQRYINGEIQEGPNLECEYYPCHFMGQDCTFCYCPFYPCGDGSTGGYWIKDKGVWSCQECEWIHEEDTVKCLKKSLDDIIKEVEDLNKKKKELLKLRRNCIHETRLM